MTGNIAFLKILSLALRKVPINQKSQKGVILLKKVKKDQNFLKKVHYRNIYFLTLQGGKLHQAKVLIQNFENTSGWIAYRK